MAQDAKSSISIPQFVAHRGYSACYPENTLLSIEQAFRAGACYAECDVQLTLDQVPVLMHDVTLQRTCDNDVNITELNWTQLNEYSAHYSAKFGEQYGKVPIPSLAQLLGLMKQWPQRKLFVEIKRASIRRFGEAQVFKAMIDALGEASDQVIVISFDMNIVQRISKHTSLPIGWVIEQWNDANLALAKQLAPDYIFVDHECIPVTLDQLPKANWRWVLYEIDDASTVGQWIEKGADFIETNNIGGLLLNPEFAQSRCDG